MGMLYESEHNSNEEDAEGLGETSLSKRDSPKSY